MFRSSILYIFAFFAVMPGALGQDELDSLDEAVAEVSETSIGTLLSRVQKLEAENVELAAMVAALQKQLEDERSGALTSLEAENARLRDSLRLVYRGRVENLPDVPLPNRDLLEEVLSDGRLKAQYEEQLEIIEAKPEAESGSAFRIIKEWGRSPEAVAQTSGNLSTLKGMSIFMHPDTVRADMEAYALALRAQYVHYDNLNIEFFDRESSAHAFAERGTVDMGFRVMSISKHAKSERDVILIGRGRSMEEVR